MKYFLALLLISSLISTACSISQPEKGLDKNKFAKLYAVSHSIKDSIDAGDSYQQVADKIKILSAEIANIKAAVKTNREERLWQAYSDLLTTYSDGLTLWRYREQFPHLDAELKGRIYVAQDVDPIVKKYGFRTEDHVYKPTGQNWKSLSPDSMRTVWKDADDQLIGINNMTNY